MPLTPNTIQEYHVFLASPGDVNDERIHVRAFFDLFNRTIARRMGLQFTVIDWENYSQTGVGRPQELITEQILNKYCSSLALVVGLMNQRFGTPTGESESGTEEEFNWALDSVQRTGWPEIKWFFRRVTEFRPTSTDPERIIDEALQWKKVIAFKKSLENGASQLLYREYDEPNSFAEILRNDLHLWLLADERPWMEGRRLTPESRRVTEQILSFNVANYRQALHVHFDRLNVDCMDTYERGDRDLKLWDIFIPQNVRECDSYVPRLLDIPVEHRRRLRERGEAIQDSEDALKDEREALQSHYSDTSPRPVLEMLDDPQADRLVLLGDPGAGKSCLLRWHALQLIDAIVLRGDAGARFPFFVELKEYHRWNPGNGSKSFLRYWAEQDSHYRIPEGAAIDYLDRPDGATVLFDGLDEIFDPQARRDVVGTIIAFGLDHPNAKLGVSSRIYGFDDAPFKDAGYRVFMLQEFEQDQIDAFLDGWHDHAFPEMNERAAKRDRIRQSLENSVRIRELAGNPLLLTMMAILNRRQELPRDRAELYNKCAEVLLGLWQTEGRKLTDAFPELRTQGIDAKDKRAILQAVAWQMQSGGERAANLIHEDELESILVDYLRSERGFTNPKPLAKALMRELHEITFTLCFAGAGLYAFVHRTFLEYFCAAEIVEQFEKKRTYTEDALIKQIYGKYWNEESWFETLCLLAGMIDPAVGAKTIDFLMQQPDAEDNEFRQVFLSAQFFREVRNVTALEPWRVPLTKRLDELSQWDWPSSYEAFEFFERRKHRTRVRLRTIPLWVALQGNSEATREKLCEFWLSRNGNEVDFTSAVITEIASTWRTSTPTLSWLKQTANVDPSWALRRAAVQELARGWKNDPDTLTILKGRAQNDDNWDVRQAAVQERARGWKNDPDTLTILKDRAQNDAHWYVRQAAIQELARGWKNDPETVTILKDRARNDDNWVVRQAAVQELARGWKDDPDTLTFLKDCAQNDNSLAVRYAAVQELARGWRNDPDTLTILKDRAQNDGDYGVRRAAVWELVRGWKNDPDTLTILKERAQNDNNNDVRRAAIQELARGWKGDPETLTIIKERAQNDNNNDVRNAAIQELARGWKGDPDIQAFLGALPQ